MMTDSKFWLRFSLVNLFIVALLGLLMRYKIGFEFPYFNQKNLQLSHSNFAFTGWISHTLMVLMIHTLQNKIIDFKFEKYKKTIIFNLICSYGMLVFFILQGYGMICTIFSVLSILVSFYFAFTFYRDLNRVDNTLLFKNWFKGALFFNVISSLGSFALAYMMMTKNIHQNEYLASIYYFLHFQYNGWFFFACMGLFFDFFRLNNTEDAFFGTSFKLFFASCIPAYFLSVLWLELPRWLYVIVVIAAVIQGYAWFRLLYGILKQKSEAIWKLGFSLRYVLLFVGFAVSIKLLLQLGSTVPFVSKLAFGFRPIVIAYLHLVLLAVITLFLLFYIHAASFFARFEKTFFGLILFSVGVLLNEIILAVQGIASFSYTMIPYVNVLLFGAAIVLVAGSSVLAYNSFKKS
ncbi:hypothetical protein [Flavobacterium saliperosum]|uniref:Uncharacterized protein n=1 Tax=Flavobacterium saliperosum TaxID=329186 RepID=A0A1G4V3M4_9FLAO|nr:hypothetical protein [Flavobacterium saliperosum]SCX00668.1 hypothetical protein SAMN02927925_00199 [Flavobacterium saliperosum]